QPRRGVRPLRDGPRRQAAAPTRHRRPRSALARLVTTPRNVALGSQREHGTLTLGGTIMQRKHPITKWVALAALAMTLGLAAGCAKKAVETQPASTPAPPQTTGNNTTPTPPAETPPTPSPTSSALGASDFRPAFFDYDSYSLRDDARAALDANAKV